VQHDANHRDHRQPQGRNHRHDARASPVLRCRPPAKFIEQALGQRLDEQLTASSTRPRRPSSTSSSGPERTVGFSLSPLSSFTGDSPDDTTAHNWRNSSPPASPASGCFRTNTQDALTEIAQLCRDEHWPWPSGTSTAACNCLVSQRPARIPAAATPWPRFGHLLPLRARHVPRVGAHQLHRYLGATQNHPGPGGTGG